MAARVEPVCPEPKVFVGQLPVEATREQVETVFRQYGQVSKCNIITTPEGRSRGCAMILFDKWSDAERAIEGENGTTRFGGARSLVVKLADPPKRADGPVVGVAPKKLFVGQVPHEVPEADMRALFSPYGHLVELHMLHKGQAIGCAFVTYSKWSEAELAMESLNGKHTFPGAKAPMVVKFADAKVGDSAKPGDKRSFNDAFQGPNKKVSTGDLGLQSFTGYNSMSGYGDMPMAGMAAMGGYGMSGLGGMSAISGLGLGASMANGSGLGLNPGMGLGVPSALGGMGMGSGLGMGMGVGLANRVGMMGVVQPAKVGSGIKDERAKNWKLFVGQVPFEATELDLQPVFAPYGEIYELVILRNNGKSKGCAFVTYASQESAEIAMQHVNGRTLPNDIRGKALVVKYANAK